MKKNFTRALALALSLLMLAACLASCGGEEVATGVKATVKLYTLEKGEASLFLGGQDLELDTGKTAFDAVDSLCTSRSCTYALNAAGMFDSFTYDGKTYAAPEQETIDEAKGLVRYYHYGWTLNGTAQTGAMKDYVLNDGDTIEVVITYDDVEMSS